MIIPVVNPMQVREISQALSLDELRMLKERDSVFSRGKPMMGYPNHTSQQ